MLADLGRWRGFRGRLCSSASLLSACTLQYTDRLACCCFPSPTTCRQGQLNVLDELPFADLDKDTLGRPEHIATAKEIAAKGTVLLKNANVRCRLGGLWVAAALWLCG